MWQKETENGFQFGMPFLATLQEFPKLWQPSEMRDLAGKGTIFHHFVPYGDEWCRVVLSFWAIPG